MNKLISTCLLALCMSLACSRIFAYNELHLMAGFSSRNEPDTLADVVSRTENPQEVPLLLMLRHTNIHPAILESVEITATAMDGTILRKEKIEYGLKLKTLVWHETRTLKLDKEHRGMVDIEVVFNLKLKSGGSRSIKNTNTRNGFPEKLKVFMGAPPLPKLSGWYYGDTHFHTLFSENGVEYGAPVEASASMAKAFGADWLVFTDHSFDLDDVEGDSNKTDPELGRWKRLRKEAAEAAKSHPELMVMVGEELSCGSIAGKNLHMLVYNNDFYRGNGDGYEGGSNAPDSPCAQITAKLPSCETAGAAHPITNMSVMESAGLNRGLWSDDDLLAPGLVFTQAWNGTSLPIPGGIEQWKRALLKGVRIPLAGGSDAHGEFNNEMAGWPANLSFGGIRTAVFVDGPLTVDALLAAIRKGRIVATSGPLATAVIVNELLERAMAGDYITGRKLMTEITAVSSEEFGPITEIRIYLGDLDKGEERLQTSYFGNLADDPVNMEETTMIPGSIKRGYVRIEAESEVDGFKFRAYSNPVWFEIK